MNGGKIEVICGTGMGKTSLALGKGLTALTEQKKVIIIQFLKGTFKKEGLEIVQRLEPDFKIFRFEKANTFFEDLTDEEKAEELVNIKNGFNFAKKVATTGECDLLILDEVLGIIDQNIITIDEFQELVEAKEPDMTMILTGKVFPQKLGSFADSILTISHRDVDKDHQA